MEYCKRCGKEVEFEIVDDEKYCPVCGWEKKASDALGKTPKVKDTSSANVVLTRIAGIAMVVMGIITLATVIGIIDIILGIGVIMRKEKFRSFAEGFKLLQVILGAAGFVVMLFRALQNPILFGSDTISAMMVLLPGITVINLVILFIVRKDSVEAACSIN